MITACDKELIPDDVDPKTLYRPRGGPAKIFPCKDSEILIEGPAGTGKTRAVLEKVYLCAMKYPKARILLVRKTRSAMTNSVLVTFEEKVVPRGSYLLNGPERHNRQLYRVNNGSEIVIGGMDKAERTLSTEYDMICAFEATELTEHDWEMLQRAKRNGRMPYQQAICDCNPSGIRHWLNLRAKSDLMTRILSRHEDNPVYFDENGKATEQGVNYIHGVLDKLSGARYLRLRLGRWAEAQGTVYPDFDAAKHVIEPFPIPSSWRRIRSIDFGFENPFVCQWWAIDNDDRMYLYREIYMSKRIVQDHAEQIRQCEVDMNAESLVEVTVADHDAEDRATLHRYNISTAPAQKRIRPGIDAVTARLKPGHDGRPRLFVFNDALVETDQRMVDHKLPSCTEYEFENYIWPTVKESVNKRNPKEVPLDRDNHGMDALRYAVAYIDGIGGNMLPLGVPSADVNITDQQSIDPFWRELNDDALWNDV